MSPENFINFIKQYVSLLWLAYSFECCYNRGSKTRSWMLPPQLLRLNETTAAVIVAIIAAANILAKTAQAKSIPMFENKQTHYILTHIEGLCREMF